MGVSALRPQVARRTPQVVVDGWVGFRESATPREATALPRRGPRCWAASCSLAVW